MTLAILKLLDSTPRKSWILSIGMFRLTPSSYAAKYDIIWMESINLNTKLQPQVSHKVGITHWLGCFFATKVATLKPSDHPSVFRPKQPNQTCQGKPCPPHPPWFFQACVKTASWKMIITDENQLVNTMLYLDTPYLINRFKRLISCTIRIMAHSYFLYWVYARSIPCWSNSKFKIFQTKINPSNYSLSIIIKLLQELGIIVSRLACTSNLSHLILLYKMKVKWNKNC